MAAPQKPEINDAKVLEAVQVFTKLVQYRTILRNHNLVASSSIPPKKERKHQLLVADWIVKVRNKQTELDGLIKAFTNDELKEFSVRCRDV